MNDLLLQLEAAHSANLYYLSLFTALALPDICGALEASDGRATGARYRDWYERYVISRYDTLSAAEAYDYRCSSLHQGRAEPDRPRDYERILFIEPRIQNLSINVKKATSGGRTAIMIDLKMLIPAVIAGVRKFLEDSSELDPVKSNLEGFMMRYPEGLTPWVKGAPTIA